MPVVPNWCFCSSSRPALGPFLGYFVDGGQADGGHPDAKSQWCLVAVRASLRERGMGSMEGARGPDCLLPVLDGAPIAGVSFLLAVSALDGGVVWVGAGAALLVDLVAELAVTVPGVRSSGKVMAGSKSLLSVGVHLAIEDCLGNRDGGVGGRHVVVGCCFSSVSSMLGNLEILPSYILQHLGAVILNEHLK